MQNPSRCCGRKVMPEAWPFLMKKGELNDFWEDQLTPWEKKYSNGTLKIAPLTFLGKTQYTANERI